MPKSGDGTLLPPEVLPPDPAEEAKRQVEALRAKIEAENAAKAARHAELQALLKANVPITEILAKATPDEAISLIRQSAREAHLAKQQTIPPPAAQSDADWNARKSYVLETEHVYGEMKDFYRAATLALVANDQTEYSRQRDLIYKALRTMFGQIPEEFQQ